MLEHKPQAVIFDMDGLILDSEVVYRTAWQQSAAELGYRMSDDLYTSFAGRRTVECEAILFETYGSKFPLNTLKGMASRPSQDWANCLICSTLETSRGLSPLRQGVQTLCFV
jgi:beta-phosphoglucomutase-like phosphatase (HAD superfamily)